MRMSYGRRLKRITLKSMPKISICVPAHTGMKNHDFFKQRLIDSVNIQSYPNYELIFTYEGRMAENTNAAMKKATGDLIKILYLDDYLTHEDSLRQIVENFEVFPTNQWLASGCLHDDGTNHFLSPHLPHWSSNILKGDNTIGSPSVITLRKEALELFDDNLSWLLDCDLYHRLYQKHGLPILLNTLNVTLGIGEHQTTHLMSDAAKQEEYHYLANKYSL